MIGGSIIMREIALTSFLSGEFMCSIDMSYRVSSGAEEKTMVVSKKNKNDGGRGWRFLQEGEWG